MRGDPIAKVPAATRDPAQVRRMTEAWRVPDVTAQDLVRRFHATDAEQQALRKEHGPKSRPTAMPEWGQIRRPKKTHFRRAAR